MINFLESTTLTEEQRSYLDLMQISAERLLTAHNMIDGILQKDDDNAAS